ncbi:hypothetical protein [Jeotgalibacillus proteolyticus]|uniref:Uncharacterized protein n=1 Tax=Jeotgalibacillus proteolyticus TaxID=2082395 RepID=A0A2S5G949_9BACL|nr:hypothetical protein [Jeotgalibacillus proteolyticus]PPA69508.1 hypothetical protein C4B60_13220 [Jeotgalibacillus proteolyticus]
MLLEPVGQVLFMEISKQLRDLKWTVNDQDFHKEGAITEADYLLPEQLINREDNPELVKRVATVKYEGTAEQFGRNDIEGIRISFYVEQIEALGLKEVISGIEEFQVEKNEDVIEYFIDKPYADDAVQFWLNKLFTNLSIKMEDIYGDQIKDIPIVLLPTKLQELPITNES